MKIVSILLIALLVLGSYSTFNYAYAVDNNCMIIPIHIIQMPIPLGCMEQRLDALENATPSGADTTICGNQGGKTLIHISGTNCDAKSLIGSPDISITNSSNTITIDYNGTLATESTNCNNLGTGVPLHKVGSNCNAFSLIAGGSISITNTTDDYTIANTSPETTTCTSAGGTSWIQSSSGGNCVLKGQTVTAPIVLTSNANDLNTSCPTCITTAPLWEKLCQTNLGSSATSISCGPFTARQHLYINLNGRSLTSTMVIGIQFNGDTATNYAHRSSLSGGADATGVSVAQCNPIASTTIATGEVFTINSWIDNNVATDRKVLVGTYSGDTATTQATAPARDEFACKWGNTVSQITTIVFMRVSGTGVYNTNTEITVWGYD